MNKIRLFRFFIISISATICLLMYVHLNVEILQVGYSITRHQNRLANLLDRHERLVYNHSKLEAPSTLTDMLSYDNIELVETDVMNIYYAGVPGAGLNLGYGEGKSGIIDRLFNALTLEAEARQED